MYLRYVCKPAHLWDWFENYLDDEEQIQIQAGPRPVSMYVCSMDIFATLLLFIVSCALRSVFLFIFPFLSYLKVFRGTLSLISSCFRTIGKMCRQLLTEQKWLGTILPRIPVPIARDIDQKLKEKPRRSLSR